jgi:lipopolysaccharide exporter
MSKFLSNVITLGSATLLGQILGVLITPILSRLYSPADFGVFQLFLSMVAFTTVASCFSYQSAINLPKKDEEASNIVILCIILIMITSIISIIFLYFFSGYIVKILNAPGLSIYLFLLPLAIITNSVAYVLGYWLSRREQFSTVAKGNLYSSITGKSVSVGIGSVNPSPFGLIFGTIINDATIVIVFLRKTIEDFHLFQEISYKKIKDLAIRYKQFPQYNLGANLAGNAAVQVTPFLLAFFFSPIIVGYYAIAYTVMILPSKLIGNSIYSVFYQKACAEKNLTGSISNVAKMVHSRLISIGIFISLIIMIIGPELFVFALGAKWFTAGVYAQILAPWFFVVFISSPLMSIFNVLEMQGANLKFNIFLLLTRIFALFLGGIFGNPTLSLILLSVTGVIFWSWMNMYLLKIAGVSVKDATREIFLHLLFGLFVCLPLIIAKYFSVSSAILIGISIILTTIYYTFIINRDTQLKEGLLRFTQEIRLRLLIFNKK